MVKIVDINNKYIIFEVKSSRGGYHEIIYDRINKQWSCTCEDYWYRKRQCKHCKEAIEYFKYFQYQTKNIYNELKSSNIAYIGETISTKEAIKEVIK